MPRGGARVGAGRKPKDPALAALHGHKAKPLIEERSAPAADAPPLEPFDPPADLEKSARAVWDELAPHAFRERTLTPATCTAFLLLCRSLVLERRLRRGAKQGTSDHRGMMQRVEAGLARFRLAPTGKPAPAAKPADPFLEFLPEASTRPQ